MRRKHSRMMAIILSTIILAGCSNSSHLSVSQTHSSPSATAQPRPTAEPLAVSVSPERSCYQQLYDQPDNPNWALYAEITITNYTDQPLTIETIFLYPNHQFYGEDASTPVLLPEDAIVALRETGLWELHADQISLDSCPVHETWPFGENQLEFPLELEAGQSQTGNIYIPGGTDMLTFSIASFACNSKRRTRGDSIPVRNKVSCIMCKGQIVNGGSIDSLRGTQFNGNIIAPFPSGITMVSNDSGASHRAGNRFTIKARHANDKTIHAINVHTIMARPTRPGIVKHPIITINAINTFKKHKFTFFRFLPIG